MSTFLTKELEVAEEWIREGLSEKRIVEIATNQCPAEKMDAFTIPEYFQQLSNPKEFKKYRELEAEFC